MSGNSLAQEWVTRPERGALPLIRLGVWIALRLGRRVARLLLYPVCLYFLASSSAATCNSRDYLARVLGRRPRAADVFSHFLTFASCALDRFFLLNGQYESFDITVHGQEIVSEIERRGAGCILFGAHFGSFEAARAIGRRDRNLAISLMMYEENARKMRAALGAINPQHATDVIGLGRPGSLIAASERLGRGHFIGMLADRNVDGKEMVRIPFLGAEAAFPRGPFRVAMLLRCPVVMMFGIYRGGGGYDVVFEALAEAPVRACDGEAWLDATMRRYVARLEHHCRQAPFNWSNFYDFWA